MGIYPTFAEALRDVMSAHKWTAESLAAVVGYRSKTSVVRILQENSSQLNRQQFLNRLIDARVLKSDEASLLRDALNTSMLGKDQACARGIIFDIIRGRSLAEMDVSPNINSAFDALESCDTAQIVLVNCMWPQIADRLGQLLAAHPAHSLKHLFTLQENGANAAIALGCTARLAYLPNYQGYALNKSALEANPLVGANMLCATTSTATGQSTDIMLLINGISNAHIHFSPAQDGLFDFWQDTLTEASRIFSPVTTMCAPTSGPESFVYTMRAIRDCEKRRATFQIAPDFCANLLSTNCLRASLTDGQLRQAFGQADPASLERLFNEFIACQHQRYEYMFHSRRAKHIMLSTSAVRRFADTGMITAHFRAMRPFTPSERLVMLRNIYDHARNDPYFHLYFFKDGFCPVYEMTCWEQHSMVCLPVNRKHELMDNYCCNVIRHPKLVKAFTGYFKDDLQKNHALAPDDTLEFLDDTVQRLEHGLDS